jgi:hypothetical protein
MKWAFVFIFCFLGIFQEQKSDRISQQEFERLHKSLEPTNETWKTIPWRISLLAAQRTAAKEDKPLFIWAMDGHPLGCT